ncbi:hypothetical protein ANN_19163 [Periplaneta americana]|uniref:Per a allergen n=1 Tax=Periplaneta americana TaxID=6978 RepID=A0ABQ8SA08_PERAM|nr:hypothetical protein ANN_19163 [Periplaneta americana]
MSPGSSTESYPAFTYIGLRENRGKTSISRGTEAGWSMNMWGVIVGGRRIKCIRFTDDMALLAEEEMILKDMLLELNGSCE